MTFQQPKIMVKTTLPTLPLAQRETIHTERLILRPFSQGDLHQFHSLRTQPEVMAFMPVGRPDRDLSETQVKLDLYIPPNDLKTFNWAVLLASTGEFIGEGGIYNISSRSSWPVVGYKFKREHWGKGYATESMRALMDAWWKLPRSEAEIETDAKSVDGATEAAERLSSLIESSNIRSLKVLAKLGFRKYMEWQEPDSRAGYEGQLVTLVGFVLERRRV